MVVAGREREVVEDRLWMEGYALLSITVSWHGSGMTGWGLGWQRWRNGPTGQPPGASIFDEATGKHVWAHVSYVSVGHRNIQYHTHVLEANGWTIRAHLITQCLDEDAWLHQKACHILWNSLGPHVRIWPDSNKNKWKEDCLTYSFSCTTCGPQISPGCHGIQGWTDYMMRRDRWYQDWWRSQSPKICGPYAGLWFPDKWGRVDCDEGSPLITYRGGIMIHKQSGKLLPLSVCGAGGPNTCTTFPSGTNGGICMDQS